MKTLADLKRDAASGKMSLEIVERFGKTGNDIPAKMQGIRKVIGSNTVCIKLLNNNGEESELRFDCAKLMEYDGETLVIYNPGRREPTAEEKMVLYGVKSIYEKYKDSYNGGFWQAKDYVKNSACPWMAGNGFIKGKMYEQHSGKVVDKSIKGDVILRYIVHMDK